MAAVKKDFGVWGIFSVREAAEIFFGRQEFLFGYFWVERGGTTERGRCFAAGEEKA